MARATTKRAPTSAPDPDMLTMSELTKRWRVSRQTVVRRIAAGLLPAFDMGDGGRYRQWRFRLQDVERYERRQRF